MRLSKLLNLLSQIDDICSGCNRCGMCQSVCPVFSVSKHEGDAARGKLALLDGLRREILNRPGKVLDRLDRCLLCGACERSCSRKVPLSEIYFKARVILNAYKGLSPLKKMIFRFILAHPQRFERLFRLGSRCQWLVLKKQPGSIRETRSMVPFLDKRRVPPLPLQSFRTDLNEKTLEDSGHERVLFFTGCLIDKMFPHVGHACINVLRAVGVDVQVMSDEVCCGIPALASGDETAFLNLRKKSLDQIDIHSYDAVVSACATCTSTLGALWPTMGGDDKARVDAVAKKTMDITEYLMTRTDIQTRVAKEFHGKKKSVTWHDPCHLKGKGQALSLVRELLSSLPSVEFHDMAGADLCCGAGGSFNLSHYDMSKEIGQKKASLIFATGVSQVITGCPGCMLQLTDMLAKQGADIRVRHIMELLSEYLSDDTKAPPQSPGSIE